MLTVALLSFLVGPPMPEPLPPGAIARLGVGGPFARCVDPHLAVSFDGRRMALRTLRGMEVWDTRTLALLRSWKRFPTATPHSLFFHSDGKTVLCLGDWLHCFDSATGLPHFAWPADRGPIAGSDSWFAMGNTQTNLIHVYSLPGGKPLRTISMPGLDESLWSASSHKGCNELVILSKNGSLYSVNIHEGKIAWEQHLERSNRIGVRSICHDPRGKGFATISPGRLVRLWTPKGQPARVLARDQGEPLALSFDGCGRLAVLFVGRAAIYDADSGVLLHTQRVIPGDTHITISPTGEFWVSGQGRRPRSFQVGQPSPAPRGHVAGISDLVARVGGGWTTLGLDRQIIQWDAGGRWERTIQLDEGKQVPRPRAIQLLPQGEGWLQQRGRGELFERVLIGLSDPPQSIGSLAPQRSAASQVVFAADGTFHVASTPSGYLQCVESRTGRIRWTRKLPNNELPTLAANRRMSLSPDGRRLVIPSYCPQDEIIDSEYALTLLDASDGNILHRLPLLSATAHAVFLDDHSILYNAQRLGGYRQLWRWNLESGQTRMMSEIRSNAVHAMVLSPDRRWIAFHTSETQQPAQIEICEAQSGAWFRDIETNHTCIRALAWSLDSRSLATGGEEGDVYVWDAFPKGKPSSDPETDWLALATPSDTDAVARLQSTPGIERLLARKLAPDLQREAHLWARYLQDLDDEDSEIRDKAETAIKQIGSRLRNPIRNALKQGVSIEVRRRLERFLRELPHDPEELRQHRAIFILEQRKATALLYRLAEGDPDADLTREARSALLRLRAAAGE